MKANLIKIGNAAIALICIAAAQYLSTESPDNVIAIYFTMAFASVILMTVNCVAWSDKLPQEPVRKQRKGSLSEDDEMYLV